MSETPTIEEGTATDAVLDLSNLTDARIENQDGFLAARERLFEAVKRAVTEAKRYTGAVKGMAEARVAIRSYLILSNGFPDWAADSDAYSVAVQTAENALLAPLGPDAARRLSQAVRQHVKRNYLLPGIVGHVLANGGGNSKLADDASRWEAGERDAVLTGPSDALVREVRKHYGAAKLSVPDGPFQESHTSTGATGGGNDPGDPPSALAALRKGLAGIGQIVPRYAVAGLLDTATAVSRKLIDGKTSDVQDRPSVIKNLHRVAVICTTTAKYLEGKADDKDTAAMEAAYFNEEADKIAD